MKKLIVLPYDEELGQLYDGSNNPLVAANDLNFVSESYGRIGDLCKLKESGFTVKEIIQLRDEDLI